MARVTVRLFAAARQAAGPAAHSLVADDYAEGLERRSEAVLRAMKADVAGVETTVSYYRRLAQARLESLAADQERRATGGSVADLVARLPEILGHDQGRSNAAQTRAA